MIKTHLLVVVLLLGTFAFADDVILPAPTSKLPPIVAIFIQGAEITPDQYVPLSKELQSQMSQQYALWVGLPESLFDTPNPESLSYGIPRVLTAMKDQGLPVQNTPIPVFFMGHSLGGAQLQNFLTNSDDVASVENLGFKIQGQILMGSFITRSYRVPNTPYPIPTLTVAGELDGLCHITRMAESFYTQIVKPWWLSGSDPTTQLDYPVLVVNGINHFAFASGYPPFLVRERDLRAEVSADEGHSLIAARIAVFAQVQLSNHQDSEAVAELKSFVSDSDLFFDPLIQGFILEGFYHFVPPCDNALSSTTTTATTTTSDREEGCLAGSVWSAYAQQYMGGMYADPNEANPVLYNATILDHDGFHLVYTEHFPQLFNNCSSSSSMTSCELNVTSVTQNEYSLLDSMDTGFNAIAAEEMRVKMISRQHLLIAAGFENVNFTESDDSNQRCGNINQKAIDWAWTLLLSKNRTLSTSQRFLKVGQPLQVIQDINVGYVGPEWVLYPLQFNSQSNPNNLTVMTVAAPSLQTPIDFELSSIAGFHYCKLLSPARALEWFFVDGLRLYYSIQP